MAYNNERDKIRAGHRVRDQTADKSRPRFEAAQHQLTEESLIALQADLDKILRVFDDHDSLPAAAELPQERLEMDDIIEGSAHLVHDGAPAQGSITGEIVLVPQVPPLLPKLASVPLLLLPGDTDHTSKSPAILDSDKEALQRLVSGVAPDHELPSFIKDFFSNVRAAEIVERLPGSDAQTFIDVMDKVLITLSFSQGLARC